MIKLSKSRIVATFMFAIVLFTGVAPAVGAATVDVVPWVSLTVEQTDPSVKIAVGDTVHVIATIENRGTDTWSKVTYTNQRHTAQTDSATVDGVSTRMSSAGKISIGTIEAGATVIVEYDVTIEDVGQVQFSAFATGYNSNGVQRFSSVNILFTYITG